MKNLEQKLKQVTSILLTLSMVCTSTPSYAAEYNYSETEIPEYVSYLGDTEEGVYTNDVYTSQPEDTVYVNESGDSYQSSVYNAGEMNGDNYGWYEGNDKNITESNNLQSEKKIQELAAEAGLDMELSWSNSSFTVYAKSIDNSAFPKGTVFNVYTLNEMASSENEKERIYNEYKNSLSSYLEATLSKTDITNIYPLKTTFWGENGDNYSFGTLSYTVVINNKELMEKVALGESDVKLFAYNAAGDVSEPANCNISYDVEKGALFINFSSEHSEFCVATTDTNWLESTSEGNNFRNELDSDPEFNSENVDAENIPFDDELVENMPFDDDDLDSWAVSESESETESETMAESESETESETMAESESETESEAEDVTEGYIFNIVSDVEQCTADLYGGTAGTPAFFTLESEEVRTADGGINVKYDFIFPIEIEVPTTFEILDDMYVGTEESIAFSLMSSDYSEENKASFTNVLVTDQTVSLELHVQKEEDFLGGWYLAYNGDAFPLKKNMDASEQNEDTNEEEELVTDLGSNDENSKSDYMIRDHVQLEINATVSFKEGELYRKGTATKFLDINEEYMEIEEMGVDEAISLLADTPIKPNIIANTAGIAEDFAYGYFVSGGEIWASGYSTGYATNDTYKTKANPEYHIWYARNENFEDNRYVYIPHGFYFKGALYDVKVFTRTSSELDGHNIYYAIAQDSRDSSGNLYHRRNLHIMRVNSNDTEQNRDSNFDPIVQKYSGSDLADASKAHAIQMKIQILYPTDYYDETKRGQLVDSSVGIKGVFYASDLDVNEGYNFNDGFENGTVYGVGNNSIERFSNTSTLWYSTKSGGSNITQSVWATFEGSEIQPTYRCSGGQATTVTGNGKTVNYMYVRPEGKNTLEVVNNTINGVAIQNTPVSSGRAFYGMYNYTTDNPNGYPTCEGAKFSGWYSDPACTANVGMPQIAALTADVTYYGYWEPVTGRIVVPKVYEGLTGNEKFNLYLDGNLVYEGVNGSNNYVIDNVTEGWHSVSEAVYDPYVNGVFDGTTGNSMNVYVTPGQDVYTYTLRNKIATGNIHIKKSVIDKSNRHTGLSGFNFHLNGKDSAGNSHEYDLISDANGDAILTGIPVGKYTLSETGFPSKTPSDCWDQSLGATEVTITAGQTSYVYVTNTYKTGTLKIVKTVTDPSKKSGKNEPNIGNAAGFKFKLRGRSLGGDEIEIDKTTDAFGECEFENIPIGTAYTVTEIKTSDTKEEKVPVWWDARDSSYQNVSIEYDKTKELEPENIYKTGNVRVTKTIEEASADRYNIKAEKEHNYNDSRAGFAFKMTGSSLSGVDGEYYAVTDKNGVAVFNNIPIGDDYTVVEVSASAVKAAALNNNTTAIETQNLATQELKQYITPIAIEHVAVTYDETTHTPVTTDAGEYHNTLVKWRASFNKQDAYVKQDQVPQQEASFEGAVYGLYDGDMLIDEYRLDVNGAIKEIKVGNSWKPLGDNEGYTNYYVLGDEWYFQELYAPEGYLIDSAKYPVNASVYQIISGEEFNNADVINPHKNGENNKVYDVPMRGSVRITKLAGDDNETDKEGLKGAGFSIFALKDVEDAYGVDLHSLSTDDIVQWMFDNVRDTESQTYRNILDNVSPAVVYVDEEDPDVKDFQLVKDGDELNRYRVAELQTADNGYLTTPRLPYGTYLLVETTVPGDRRAAAPRVLYIDHDNHDESVYGDGKGDAYGDIVIWDKDLTAYIKLIKKDAVTKKAVNNINAAYVIHDVDGAYFKLYMEDRETEEQEAYKEIFGDLVGSLNGNYGSRENPFVTRKNGKETCLYTPMALPAGHYQIEEVAAPENYVLQGKEGTYRTDDDDNTVWEIENPADPKWNDTLKNVSKSDKGTWVPTGSPAVIDVTISVSNAVYDKDGSGDPAFVEVVEQYNEPAVGKIAIYAESGEYLKGVAFSGSTLSDRVTDDFKGYVAGEESSYKNPVFEYVTMPAANGNYTVRAAEDIYSEGYPTGTLLWAAGDVVTTLTTNENGEAWTEEIYVKGYSYKGLPIGKYTVTQETPGYGLVTSPESSVREFSIDYEGQTVPIVYRDEIFMSPRQKIHIAVAKYAMKNAANDEAVLLPGAVFGLYAGEEIKNANGETLFNEGDLVAVSETDEAADGSVTLAEFKTGYKAGSDRYEDGGLPNALYVVREISAPKGYYGSNEELVIDARYDKNHASEEILEFVNKAYGDGYSFENEESKLVINLMDYNTKVGLDGAKFTLFDEGGKEVGIYTSKHESLLIKGLEVNKTYTLKETDPRSLYTYDIYINNDYASKYAKEGYTEKGNTYLAKDIEVLSTEAENEATFIMPDLAPGSGAAVVNIFNKPINAKLEITKTGEVPKKEELDADGTKQSPIIYETAGLPGAVYEVRTRARVKHPDGYSSDLYQSDEVVATIRTNAKGKAEIKELPVADYDIIEITAPEGYYKDSNPADAYFLMEYEDNKESSKYSEKEILKEKTITDQRYEVKLTAKKIGVTDDGEKGVKDAEFTLRAQGNIVNIFGDIVIPAGTIVDKKTSQDDGTISFREDLPAGIYEFFESRSPEGYYHSNAVITLDASKVVREDTKDPITAYGEIRNPETKVTIFLRDDLTKNELSGAKLSVYKKEDFGKEDKKAAAVKESTVNTNGEGWTIKGLEPGETYVIVEDKPRDNYTYIIRDENGTQLNEETPNVYEFRMPDTSCDEDLGNTPETKVINLYNAFITGNINVTKTGEVLKVVHMTEGEEEKVLATFEYDNDKLLEGVEFTVYADHNIYHPDGVTGKQISKGEIARINVREIPADDEPVLQLAVVETNHYGIAEFEGLFPGSYTIEETSVPDGYVKQDIKKAATIAQTAGDYTTQVVAPTEIGYKNIRQRLNVKVTKKDVEKDSSGNDILLSGAKFGLFAAETIFSEAENKVSAGGNQDTDGEAEPEPAKKHTAIDPDTLIATATTDEDGEATFVTDLPLGRYYVKELSAPKGYILNDEKQYIDASEYMDGRDNINANLTFENERTRVVIDLMDINTLVELEGATINIKEPGSNGQTENIVKTVTSSYGMNEVIEGLEPGKTYAVEVAVPRYGYVNTVETIKGYKTPYLEEGYTVNNKQYSVTQLSLNSIKGNTATFTVSGVPGVQIVPVFNRPVTAELLVTKNGPVAEVVSGIASDSGESTDSGASSGDSEGEDDGEDGDPASNAENAGLPEFKYTLKGLPHAFYKVYADETVAHPDGHSAPIYKEGDLVTDTDIETDDKGEARVSGLYPAKYKVVETKAPAGYVRVASKAEKSADLGKTYADIFKGTDVQKYGQEKVSLTVDYQNERQKLDIGNPPEEYEGEDPMNALAGATGIIKKDGMDATVPVKDAVFGLYVSPDEDVRDVYGNLLIAKNVKVAQATTDENGFAAFNVDLPVGKYVVREISAPDGYYSTNAEYEVNGTQYIDDDKVGLLRFRETFEDQPVRVKVFLQDDLTKYELSGAILNIYECSYDKITEQTEPVYTINTINTRGKGSLVEGLKTGVEYTIVESQPRPGYTYIIRDENGEPVNNPETDIPQNIYRFTIPDVKVEADLSNKPEDIVINLYNRFVTGEVTVTKKGEVLDSFGIPKDDQSDVTTNSDSDFGYTDTEMSGVEFRIRAAETIYHPDGSGRILYNEKDIVNINVRSTGDAAVVETDERGIAVFGEMYLGKYVVEEVSIPNGYEANRTKVDVVLACPGNDDYLTQVVQAAIVKGDSSEQGPVSYTNIRQKVKLTVHKVDKETGNGLQAAQFGLYTKDEIKNAQGIVIVKADTMIETVTTGEDGSAVFESDLPLAQYYIKEIKQPSGYAMSDVTYDVDASYVEDGRATIEKEFVFKNEQTKLRINVYDNETLQELDGAELTIVASDNSEKKVVSVHNGTALVRGLNAGERYTIKEIKPRYGYANNIYDKDGFESRYQTEGVTYEDIHFDAYDIPMWQISGNTAVIKVQDTGLVQVVNIFNNPVRTNLEIVKEGDVPVATVQHEMLTALTYEKAAIPGAVYEVYAKEEIVHPDGYTGTIYSSGEKVAEVVTGEDGSKGSAWVNGLIPGSYHIEEMKAPYGYSKVSEEATSGNEEEVSPYDSESGNVYKNTYWKNGDSTTALFKEELFDSQNKIYNKRQIVDIGTDDACPKPENPQGDPGHELIKITGVYKTGVDGDKEYPVQNAVFSLYAAEDIYDVYGTYGDKGRIKPVIPAGTFIQEATSDKNGRAAFRTYSLPVGKYVVRETTRPYGYYSSDAEVYFDADAYADNDEVQIIRMKGEIKNPLTQTRIFLRDVDTGVELEDAQLIIQDPSGTTFTTIATKDTEGEGHLVQGLNPGTEYTIVEESPRTNYTKIIRKEDGSVYEKGTDDPEKMHFTISDTYVHDDLSNEPETYVINLYNEFITGNVTVYKTGQVLDRFGKPKTPTEPGDTSGRPMTPAEMAESLFGYRDKNLEDVEFTIYAAEDISHPDGKTGDGSIFLMGDKVLMHVHDDAVQAVMRTDRYGKAAFTGLYPGRYMIMESSTPYGYAKNDTPTFITIKAKDTITQVVYAEEYTDENGDKTVDYVNIRQKVSIEVTKKDIETEEPLAGATFALYANDPIYDDYGLHGENKKELVEADTFIEEQVTDDSGKALFKADLPLGTYYIKEVSQPSGYTSSDERIDIDATYREDGRDTINIAEDFYNEQTKVRINVMDSETYQELDGAELVLKDETGNTVKNVVSVHDGTPIVRGLIAGKTYTIEEVKPREGYKNTIHVKDGFSSKYTESGFDIGDMHFEAQDIPLEDISENRASFTVKDENGVQVINIFNDAVKSPLVIEKKGEVLLPENITWDGEDVHAITYTTCGIPGAEYTVTAAEDVYYPDGYTGIRYAKGTEIETELITDTDGIAIIEGLYPGFYRVEETKAPKGYSRVMNDSSQDADIYAVYKEKYFDSEKYADKDYDEFKFVNTFENERQKVDIGGGDHITPDPVNPGDDPHVPAGDPNIRLKGKTGVYKVGVDDGNEKYLKDAEFTLYAEKPIRNIYGQMLFPTGTKIETAKSGSDGRAKFVTDLPVGSYYVEETKAPFGYYRSDAKVYFDTKDYEDNDSVQVIRMNGTIKNPITKVRVFLRDNLTDNELAGAYLMITDPSGKQIQAVNITQDTVNKGVLVKGLDPNLTYQISELEPRTGYLDDILNKDGTVMETGNIMHFTVPDVSVNEELSNIPADYEINLYNKFVTGNIVVSKKGEILSGKDVDDKLTYDKDDMGGVEFTVRAASTIFHPDGSGIAVYHAGDIVATNVRTSGEPAVLKTTADGMAVFYGMYLGQYVIEESSVPEGYAGNKKTANATLSYKDRDTEVVWAEEGFIKYENTLQKADITVTKIDTDTGKKVKGASFGLYAAEDFYTTNGMPLFDKDVLVDTATTDENGKAVFAKGLPLGQYYIKETEAPDGYIRMTEQIDVDASYKLEDGETRSLDYECYNEPIKVVPRLMDLYTENELSGAQIVVKDAFGKEVDRFLTTDRNTRFIRGLKENAFYSIYIEKARDGYSNNIYTNSDYVSEYAENGFKSAGKTFAAEDILAEDVYGNTATFTVSQMHGVQILNLFSKPVESTLHVEKQGYVPSAAVSHGIVGEISYTMKGLPGAEYDVFAAEEAVHPDGKTGVIYDKDEKVTHIVTDETGTASVSGLPVISYRIVETKAPYGYSRLVDNCSDSKNMKEVYDAALVSDGAGVEEIHGKVTFTNERQKVDLGTGTEPSKENPGGDPDYELLGKAGVYKIGLDGDKESYVAGAEFTLYAKEDIKDVTGKVVINKGAVVDTAESDRTGRAVFEKDIPVGSYLIKETKAPAGYYLTDEIVEIKADKYADNDEVQVVRFSAEFKDRATETYIYLQDDLTGNELKDATLVITEEDGDKDKVVTTIKTRNTNGKGHLVTGLVPGVVYKITETVPRQDYTNIIRDKNGDPVSGDETYTFTISEKQEKTEIHLYNAFITGKIKVSKNGDILSGAQTSNTQETTKTDFNYEDKSPLAGAEFTIYAKENLEHPDGVTGVLVKKDAEAYMDVRNNPVKAVALTKTDGTAEFEGLYPGTYYLIETKAPDGYAPITKVVEFTVAADNYNDQEVTVQTEASFTNEQQKISIVLIKKDAQTGMALQGAVYGLYAQEDIRNRSGQIVLDKDMLIESAVSGEDGRIEFAGKLPLGRYYVKEISAPDGYTISPDKVKVEASGSVDADAVIEIHKTVTDMPTKVVVSKLVKGTTDRVIGALLEVKDEDGSIVDSWASGSLDYQLKGLTLGKKYILHEVKAPAGYAKADDVEFTVNGTENQTVVMEDAPVTVNITVWEQHSDGSLTRLPGVSYHIVDTEGNLAAVNGVDQIYKSNGNAVTINHMPVKEFALHTDSVPEGYVLPGSVPMVVRDTTDIQYYRIIVNPITIDVYAVDADTNEVLDGVKVDIDTDHGTPLYTNAELEHIDEHVPAGNYTIKVKEVPDGYVIPVDSIIRVKEVDTIQKYVVLLRHTKIKATTYDSETKEDIPGICYNIYDENGSCVHENVTVGTVLEYIAAGKYTIQIKSVPDGYVMPDDSEVTVKATRNLQHYKIPVKPVKIGVVVVDKETQDAVSGAEMELMDADGTVKGSWTSDTGWKFFDYVKEGEYQIKATSVPKGYKKPEVKHITVQKITDLQKFMVELEKKTETEDSKAKNGTGGGFGGGGGGISGGGSGGSGGLSVMTPKTGDTMERTVAEAIALLAMILLLAGVLLIYWDKKKRALDK